MCVVTGIITLTRVRLQNMEGNAERRFDEAEHAAALLAFFSEGLPRELASTTMAHKIITQVARYEMDEMNRMLGGGEAAAIKESLAAQQPLYGANERTFVTQ